MVCSGQNMEYCGGSQRLNVYMFDPADVASSTTVSLHNLDMAVEQDTNTMDIDFVIYFHDHHNYIEKCRSIQLLKDKYQLTLAFRPQPQAQPPLAEVRQRQ